MSARGSGLRCNGAAVNIHGNVAAERGGPVVACGDARPFTDGTGRKLPLNSTVHVAVCFAGTHVEVDNAAWFARHTKSLCDVPQLPQDDA